MTVPATPNIQRHTGNGTTGPWAYPYRYLDNNHLKFLYRLADGTEGEFVQGVDYSISSGGPNDPTGCVLTTTNVVASGVLMAIFADTPAEQNTTPDTLRTFREQAFEQALDALAIQNRKVVEDVGRALVRSPIDPGGQFTLQNLTPGYVVTIQDADTLRGDEVLADDVANAQGYAAAAAASAAAASASETKAQQWAEEDEDVPVEAGMFSAKHYAIKAAEASIRRALSLSALPTTFAASELVDGLPVFVEAYHPPSFPQTDFFGGGLFVYSATTPKSSHNGGTIISPTVPWTWADNGVSYIAGTGETDAAGNGCWVRTGNKLFTPFEFGARPGTTIDSTASVHAALDHCFADINDNTVFEGGGVKFGVSSSYRWTFELFRLRIQNLHLQAISTFTGAIIELLPQLEERLNDVRFVNCILQGGPRTQVAFCDGLLLLDNTMGFWFDGCQFNNAKEYLIKNLQTGPGSETHIQNCHFDGAAEIVGNENVTAIDLEGADNMISGCLLRQFGTGIKIRSGGGRIINNHIYNFGEANFDAWGFDITFGKNVQILNNQVDDVRTRFYNPTGIIVNDNRFLQSSGDNWSVWRAFIWFISDTAGYVPERISIQGNTVQSGGGATARFINSAVEGSGTFDFSTMNDIFIKNNVIDANFGEQTSHPAGVLTYTSTDFASQSVDTLSPWGTSQATPFKYVRSAAFNNGPGDPTATIARTYIRTDTKVAQVVLSASVASGTAVFEATCNANGE